MKIGILTFHASHNYGSMLQAYALQKTLRKIGYSSEIINLRTKIQKGLIPPPIEIIHPIHTIKRILKSPAKVYNLQRKHLLFEKFLANNLITSKELRNKEEVEQYIIKKGIDTIIVGSDQIWNPGCWDFDESYILNFNIPLKRISYAPSIGSNPERIDQKYYELFNRCWNKFDYLSTREERSASFVKKIIGKNVQVVLDPTLLLKSEDYRNLYSHKSIIKEPYILYYTPREEKGTFGIAKLLSEKLNLKILVTQYSPEYIGDNVIKKYNCGPKEFLNIISNAEYTIGNSFHLLAFSLIFKKEFFLISKERDSRMLNILEPIGLENGLLTHNINEIEIPSPINFSYIDTKLDEMRIVSFNYLKNSLR